MLTIKRFVPMAVGVALVLSACSSGSTTTETTSAPAEATDFSAQAAELDALTYTQLSASLLAAAPALATLKDGSTFTLNPEIAVKIAGGEPINYVISYGSKSIPLFSQQYLIGYDDTLPIASSILHYEWCRCLAVNCRTRRCGPDRRN